MPLPNCGVLSAASCIKELQQLELLFLGLVLKLTTKANIIFKIFKLQYFEAYERFTNALLRKFRQKSGTLCFLFSGYGAKPRPWYLLPGWEILWVPLIFLFQSREKRVKLRFEVVWHNYASPTSTLFSDSLFVICTMNIVHGNIQSRFPMTCILRDICHSLTLGMSWEQWTQSNTGHLSVSNWLSLNMTQVKEVIRVQPRLVVLTFHLFGFLVWQTSFVNPCRLNYHVEFRWLSDPPTTALQQIGCHVNTLLVQCTHPVPSSIASSVGVLFEVG